MITKWILEVTLSVSLQIGCPNTFVKLFFFFNYFLQIISRVSSCLPSCLPSWYPAVCFAGQVWTHSSNTNWWNLPGTSGAGFKSSHSKSKNPTPSWLTLCSRCAAHPGSAPGLSQSRTLMYLLRQEVFSGKKSGGMFFDLQGDGSLILLVRMKACDRLHCGTCTPRLLDTANRAAKGRVFTLNHFLPQFLVYKWGIVWGSFWSTMM